MEEELTKGYSGTLGMAPTFTLSAVSVSITPEWNFHARYVGVCRRHRCT